MKIKNISIDENILENLIKNSKNKKPQFGNSRSFACNAKRKSWKCNKQKFRVNGKSYFLPQSEIKSIKKKIGV